MKITGSMTVAETVKAFFPNGGEFRLELTGAATAIAGAMVSPVARVSAGDFFLACARAGAVGESIAAGAAEFAIARAGGGELPADLQTLADKFKARAETIGAEWAKSVPPIERAASVRVKGKARQV